MRRIPAIAWRVVRGVSEHELVDRAAQVAFYGLFAVFPVLLVLVGLLGVLDLSDEVARLAQLMEQTLPESVARPLLREVQRVTAPSGGGGIALGLAISLFSTSRALAAVVRSIHMIWHSRRRRSALVDLLSGLGLSVLLIVVAVVVLVLMATGERLLGWALERGLLGAGRATVFRLLRWPLALLLLQQVLNLVYRAAVPRRLGWGLLTAGSVFSTLGWVAMTRAFAWYVGQVVDLGATYGSLGAVIGLPLYIYAVAEVVLVGAELDYQLRS